MTRIDPNWTEVVDNSINVPDGLMPLFYQVGTQIRFHTISGKSETETCAHIVEICRRYFSKLPELLTDKS